MKRRFACLSIGFAGMMFLPESFLETNAKAQPVCEPRYEIEILWQGFCSGINERGDLIGSRSEDGREIGFVWSRGEMFDLPTLGGEDTHPWAINDNGVVVGISEIKGDSPPHVPFIYQDGRMEQMFPLEGEDDRPIDISNSGIVVGKQGASLDPAFMWKDGDLTLLPTYKQGWDNVAASINEAGIIVGHGVENTQLPLLLGFQRAIKWVDGELIPLPGLVPGDYGRHANDINEQGVIVGFSKGPEDFVGSPVFHAVMWVEDDIIDIGLVDGFPDAEASFINDHNQVVGLAYDSTIGDFVFEGFLWENGVTTLFSDLVSREFDETTDWEIWFVFGINNAGEIAGRIIIDGSWHAYLMTPIGAGLADLNRDDIVGAEDVMIVLSAWGPCTDDTCCADLNGDKIIGPADLAVILGNWG